MGLFSTYYTYLLLLFHCSGISLIDDNTDIRTMLETFDGCSKSCQRCAQYLIIFVTFKHSKIFLKSLYHLPFPTFFNFFFYLNLTRIGLLEIKNLFYKRVLAKTGSSTVSQLQTII